ncbi:MAG: hypothetical protein K1X57_17625 [Gemmataceae bacterium]|nr:hypothetical protein [Gemmataceae bacterium]
MDAQFFGGAGDQRGTGISVVNGNVMVVGSNGSAAQLVQYPTSLAGPSASSTLASTTSFTGVAGNGATTFAVGSALPPACGAVDSSGGIEQKPLFSRYDSAGAYVACQSANLFGYNGGESFQSAVVANEGGTPYVYVSGYGQSNGANNTAVLLKYNATGGNVWTRTPGDTGFTNNSNGAAVTLVAGSPVVAGYTHYPYTDPNATRGAIWRYDTAGNASPIIQTTFPAFFLGITHYAGNFYVVGNSFTPGVGGSENFLIQKYNAAGTLVWSMTSGGASTDVLTGIVAIGGSLYASGYTSSIGNGGTDAVVLKIDPSTGNTVCTTLLGGTLDDRANGVATDGTSLFVVGESRSFTYGGNGAGQNDLVVLKYAVQPTLSLFSADSQFASLTDIATDGKSGFFIAGSDGVGSGFDTAEVFRTGMNGGAATIFSAANAPLGITADDQYVYWIDPNGDPDATAIFRVPVGGGTRDKIYSGFATGQPVVDGSGIEYVPGSAGTLITADEVQGSVHRMTATNPVSSITSLGTRYGGYFDREHYNSVTVFGGIAYIADSGRSGFGDTPPRIDAIPVAGGSFTNLYTGTLPGFSPKGIVVAGNTIYMTSGNQILSMPTTGGTPTVFMADPQFGNLAGLTYHDDALYVCDNPTVGTAKVWKVDMRTIMNPFPLVHLNDFTAQRSMVTSATVTFSQPVAFVGNPADAFVVERTGPTGTTGNVTLSVDFSQSTAFETVAKITFSGSFTQYNSLIDGTYRLTVLAANVYDGCGLVLDGNADGLGGDNLVYDFHRLFGDADGNRTVDSSDFLAFRLAFLSNSPTFDFDGNGTVDSSDFLQFRLHFLQSV